MNNTVISCDELIANGNEIKDLSFSIKNDLIELFRNLDLLDKYWSGPAYDSFVLLAKNRKIKMYDFCDALSKYGVLLSDVGEKYNDIAKKVDVD